MGNLWDRRSGGKRPCRGRPLASPFGAPSVCRKRLILRTEGITVTKNGAEKFASCGKFCVVFFCRRHRGPSETSATWEISQPPHRRFPLLRFWHRLPFFFCSPGFVSSGDASELTRGNCIRINCPSGDRASAHKHERLHNVARLLRPLPAAFRVTVSANAAKPRSSVRGSRSASSSHPPRFSGDGL